MKRLWFLIFFACMNLGFRANEEVTATLVFKGVQRKEGVWMLWFADKENASYFFNAQKSKTEPYVFFTTGLDGGLRENQRIRGSWFLITYSTSRNDKINEKIIHNAKYLTSVKFKTNKR